MAKITAPVKGFTGKVIGVTFADGSGETKDEGQISYFQRHGYTVTGAKAALTAEEKAAAENAEAEAKAAETEKVKAAEEAEALKKAAAEPETKK